jgi:hypothetical protein
MWSVGAFCSNNERAIAGRQIAFRVCGTQNLPHHLLAPIYIIIRRHMEAYTCGYYQGVVYHLHPSKAQSIRFFSGGTKQPCIRILKNGA